MNQDLKPFIDVLNEFIINGDKRHFRNNINSNVLSLIFSQNLKFYLRNYITWRSKYLEFRHSEYLLYRQIYWKNELCHLTKNGQVLIYFILELIQWHFHGCRLGENLFNSYIQLDHVTKTVIFYLTHFWMRYSSAWLCLVITRIPGNTTEGH